MHNPYAIVRMVLRLAAMATLAIGLALLVFAKAIVDWAALGDGANEHYAIYLGSALIGFSVTNWLYSRSRDIRMVTQALYGNVVSLSIATVIDVKTLIDFPNSMPLIVTTVLHVVFLLAFSYCILVMRQPYDSAAK